MFKQTNPIYIFISSYANNNNTRELNNTQKIPKAHQVEEQGGGIRIKIQNGWQGGRVIGVAMISLVLIFYAQSSQYKMK